MTADHISLYHDGTQMRARWPRRAAEWLFIGKPGAQILPQIPLLFALCGHAQSLAARLALACAAGQPAQATAAERAALQQEAARETLRRWLLDWAPACGQHIAPADVLALGRARSADALRELACASIFGDDIAAWRAGADWQQWAAAGATAGARALAQLLQAAPEHGVPWQQLPDAAGLAAGLSDWLRPTGPVWHGQPCEVGAVADYQTLLLPLQQQGKHSAARLLARWLRLADCLLRPDALQVSVATLGDGGALARVDTARGPLLHLLSLDGAGCISRYRVLPPTLWHTHEYGAMARAADGASAQQAQCRLLLIDPCTSFTLSPHTTEEPVHA